MLYPIAIYQANGRFVAHAPDLPTLPIVGETMADVIHNARVVIIDYLQDLANHHQPIPKGNNISGHLDNPDYFGRTWAIISLDSLRFGQATVAYQLPLPKKTLDDIYQMLGENSSTQTVQDFIIAAIEDKLAS